MIRLPGKPSRKRVAVLILGGGATLIVVVFLLIYFVIFPTSSPKPFKLATSTATPATAASAASSASSASVSSGGVGGRWNVATGSQAGYRVREKLAFLPAQSDAVGRTSSITGAATLTESKGTITIATASFNVAVNTLKSDRSMRDEKIHEIGLESSRYPTATFVLAAPVRLTSSAVAGHVTRASVTGVFTIHGTSKKETLPVEFTLSGSALEAVGSITFPWGEFGMTAPSVGGFVNVTEKATMEFDLHLQRA
jgi:polyisoprenoid-binding protein YceI